MRTKLAMVALLAACLCGCCAVKVTHEGGQDLVNVENSALKLFGIIPICSGDADYPNREVAVWFTDSTTLKTNMTLLDESMRRGGYTSCEDITSYRTGERVLFFFFRREVLHTSARLIR